MTASLPALTALLLGLLASPAAEASTIKLDGGRIVFTEAPGDVGDNELFLKHQPAPAPFGTWRFTQRQTSNPVVATPPCADVLGDFDCPAGAAIQPMTITLSTQFNKVLAFPGLDEPATDLILDGGAGNDRLSVTADGGPKRIFGGEGADVLAIGSQVSEGGESIRSIPGDYFIDGGPGDDTAQAGNVGGNLFFRQSDGTVLIPPPGPLSPDAPIVYNPELFGDPNGPAATLLGGTGNDVLAGGPAIQTFQGGDGNDIVHAGRGDDVIDGGPGNDLLVPDVGADLVQGGDGNDTIEGQAFDGSWYYGGLKPIKEGFVSDSFSCGPGDDWAIVDPVDRVSSDCEHIGTRGSCFHDAEACAGNVSISAAGTARAKSGAYAKRGAKRKRTPLGKGRFKGEGGTLINQVASLNAKAGQLVAAKGVVKAQVKVTCTTRYKRRKARTKTFTHKLILASDPTDPSAIQTSPGKLAKVKCR